MVRKKNDDTDLANVEKARTFLTAEEYPEGPYGSPRRQDEPVENKSTPWEVGQQYYSSYTFENRNLHDNIPRKYPGAHPTHDENDKKTEAPYDDAPNVPSS